LWIRTPLIPGATADHENIDRIARFIAAETSDVVNRWELCAFNNLCRDKYRRLGLHWEFAQTPLMTQTILDECRAFAQDGPFDPQRLLITGPTRAKSLY